MPAGLPVCMRYIQDRKWRKKCRAAKISALRHPFVSLSLGPISDVVNTRHSALSAFAFPAPAAATAHRRDYGRISFPTVAVGDLLVYRIAFFPTGAILVPAAWVMARTGRYSPELFAFSLLVLRLACTLIRMSLNGERTNEMEHHGIKLY